MPPYYIGRPEKTASYTSDFAPMLLLVSRYARVPYWRRICLADYVQTWRHTQNRKYIALSPEDGRATANTYRRFCEV